MAETEVKIADDSALQKWFQDKPAIWAQAIASRVALRVLPLVGEVLNNPGFSQVAKNRILLSVFRANHLVWMAVRFPKQDFSRFAAEAAAAVAVHDGAPVATLVAARAADAVSIGGLFDTATISDRFANVIRSAKNAGAKDIDVLAAQSDLWISISDDAEWLDNKNLAIDPKNQALTLLSQRLWLSDVRKNSRYSANFPPWTRDPWDKLVENSDVLEAGFANWIAWYRSLLPNRMNGPTKSHFGDELDGWIARRPESWWKGEPSKLNAEIAHYIKDAPPNDNYIENLKPTVAQFILNYLENRTEPAFNAEIARAFRAAKYPVIQKTMRGQLSRLASAGRIRRVAYGLYEAAQADPPHADIKSSNLADEIAVATSSIRSYVERLPTGSPVVVTGKFFSLEGSWGATDVETAVRLRDEGRVDASKRKVDRLLDRTQQRLKNYQIWNDLIETLPDLSDWLAMPPNEMAKKVGVAWELSVTVGRFIDLDKKLVLDSKSSHLPLDADLRLSLEDVNGSVGTLLREFPTGAAMDDRHREWNASQETLEVARAIFANIEKTNILLTEYLPLIARALKSDDLQSVQGKKSAVWGVGTVKRIGFASLVAAGAITGGIVAGATGEVGAEIVRQSQLSDKAAKLVLKSKDELVELTKDAPADIRNAVEDLIRKIEESQK